MAKANDAPATAPEQDNKVTVAAQPVYLFQQIGSDREYEIDAKHLGVMLSRSDLRYIGNIPLPKGALKNEVTIN